MANNLLSELLDNVRRLYYTIDDCYAQANILTGEPLLAELAEELEPLQALLPKVKTPLLLVQKYYSQYVDVAAILAQADADIVDYQAQIEAQQKQSSAAKAQLQSIAAAQKTLAKDIEKLEADLANYEKLNQELVHEQGVLSPLMEKSKYQKIYKEIQQQASQYNIGILEAKDNIKNISLQIDVLAKDAAKAKADELSAEEQITTLTDKIAATEQAKTTASVQPDFQAESQALKALEQFFEAVKNKNIEAYIRQDDAPLPKNWRNVLDSLCKSRLPKIGGVLSKKSPKDKYAQLVRENLAAEQFKIAAALSGLRHSLNEKTGIQFEDCAYLPVHAEVLAKVSFREKGRIVAALSKNPSSDSDEYDEEGEESSSAGNSIEIFVNETKNTAGLPKNCSPNLYILFKQYVIEIDFLPQF